MSLIDPQIPKEYKNGRVLFEQNLDAWRLTVEDYFATINLNLTQLRKDSFLANYDFTNTGNASLPKSLQQQINDLTSGATPIGGTTSDTWTINSDGNAIVLSSAGLTTTRTYTFPDASGVIVVAAATQNLSGKTFTDNIVWSSGIAFTGTLDHANTADRVYTFPDASGSVVLSSGGAGTAIFTTNVDVYNGFSFRAYSDAGTTLKASINGATGAASFGGASVGTTNGVTVTNTDNTNGLSHARLSLTTGGAAGGDPYFRWQISGTASEYYAGIDNSDSDKWIFGVGGDVGTTPIITYNPATNILGFGAAGAIVAFNLTTADASFVASNVGTATDFTIENTDNTNTASNAILSVFTGGASGGDPTIRMGMLGGVGNWYVGVDNSDSDKLVIGSGAVVGTTPALTINSTLETLLPAVDPPTANYMNSNSTLKSWGSIDGPTGAPLGENYNWIATGRNALGSFDVQLQTDQAIGNYVVGATVVETANTPGVCQHDIQSLGEYYIYVWDCAGGGAWPGAAADHDFSTWTMGTQ